MKVAEIIEQKLTQAFEPIHLVIEDESHMHAVAPGSESHFKITLVSSSFENQPLIQQHRMVNESLKQELVEKIHAMALHCYTPDQWFARAEQSPESPPCEGTNKAEQPNQQT